MATKNIMLDWMPTTALQEFIEYHWYYLPESIAMMPISRLDVDNARIDSFT